ncbi:MAG: hypothetical protein IT328_15830 [Caldilineaceae bacterium]|nr:hypothetical protein [Caldilineaceae bacterium]
MNPRPNSYTFQRYLAAKRTVDDRALNHHVWESLHTELARRATPDHPLQILELGGGIGTMVERLLEEGRLPEVTYHLLDEQPDNIAAAVTRLSHACSLSPAAPALSAPQLHRSPNHQLRAELSAATALNLNLYTSDLYEFLSAAGSLNEIDLILAHAFMDLVNIPATLPLLTATLSPGALLYFTINFDGATIFEPAIDPAFDAHIEQIYHRTMDERITAGKPSGDSHTGRHLFHQMQTAGIQTLDAGSSDWVIIPHHGLYPHDESYFLHFIIHTMHDALLDHPAIDVQRFQAWIAARHAQIERGELIYIAHQLDYLGEYQG